MKLDVKGYTAIVKELESLTNAKSTSTLNQNIQERVYESLKKIGLEKGKVLRCEGDSALVCFKVADDAHYFSETVHHEMDKWNIQLTNKEVIFRIGCSTGELDLDTYDGYLNAIAYRLEPNAEPGGTLIDPPTYLELSDQLQMRYDREEIVTDKNGERYKARRWLGCSRKKTEIETRILDIPQLKNSRRDFIEVIALNLRGEEINRQSRYVDYLVEDIIDQEIRMMTIPSGEYGMGSSVKNSPRDEKPKHLVRVSAFLMSQFPITKAQWKAVAGYPQINQELKKRPVHSGALNSPVVKVSWNDAVEFCNRLSAKTGHIYRLPTEAEWEFACRAETDTDFHFGKTISAQHANYDARTPYRSESPGIYREKVCCNSEFKFYNNFGLLNMHGNVWEWCLDHWHDNYKNAPRDGKAWITKGESRRVMRGGSWRNEAALCASSYRFSTDENYNDATNVGFRIVREICHQI